MAVTIVDEWRSGTGKVIRVGDVVRVDSHLPNIKGSYRYRVRQIRTWPAGGDQPEIVEVDVFGGKPQHEQFHTFTPAALHTVRQRVTS